VRVYSIFSVFAVEYSIQSVLLIQFIGIVFEENPRRIAPTGKVALGRLITWCRLLFAFGADDAAGNADPGRYHQVEA
jgi:hypothetical protein